MIEKNINSRIELEIKVNDYGLTVFLNNYTEEPNEYDQPLYSNKGGQYNGL